MGNEKNPYLSPRTIREKMDVSAGTVRRWAKKYGWRIKKINSRVLRYETEDVEQSLGIKF
ncbi:MAG: hypothetical protein CL532_00850 [Aestuariivita sp.]|nr:hypothetical protein [Aestuariivita sp.]|tara:strand:+ start:1297 stop:1476 length:180 start_codon:yes stop_codon:yes gene_type:complete